MMKDIVPAIGSTDARNPARIPVSTTPVSAVPGISRLQNDSVAFTNGPPNGIVEVVPRIRDLPAINQGCHVTLPLPVRG